jgi:hypothetical protein
MQNYLPEFKDSMTNGTLFLTKDGVMYDYKFDDELDKFERVEMTGKSVLSKLFERISIQEGFTVKALITFMDAHKHSLDPICDMWLTPLLEEYHVGVVSDCDEDYSGYTIEYSKVCDMNIYETFIDDEDDTWGDPHSHASIDNYVSMRDPKEPEVNYGIGGNSIKDIEECELRFEPTFDIVKSHNLPLRMVMKEADKNGMLGCTIGPEYPDWERDTTIVTGVQADYTMFDVIRTLVFELTFYGLGQTRAEFIDMLSERCDKVRAFDE